MNSVICSNKGCHNGLTEYQAKFGKLQICRDCRSFDGLFVQSELFVPVRHLCVKIDTSRKIRRYHMRCPTPGCKTVRTIANLKAANKPCFRCCWKVKERPFAANYRRLVSSAKARDYALNFSYKYFLKLCKCERCFYCNQKLHRFAKISSGHTGAATCLDRIDSQAGYVLGNLASCCKDCNLEKREYLTGRQYAVYRALRDNDADAALRYLQISDRQFATLAKQFFFRK